MQWEYRVIELGPNSSFWGGKFDAAALANMLNEHGEKGWEVTTAFDTNMAYGQSRAVMVILKRPRT